MPRRALQTIEAEVVTTADLSNALAGTPLDRAPGPGAVAIYLASTVVDSRASVLVGSKELKRDSVIGKVIANAQVDIAADSALATQVQGGEPLYVDLDVVGAGTIRVKAVWLGILP